MITRGEFLPTRVEGDYGGSSEVSSPILCRVGTTTPGIDELRVGGHPRTSGDSTGIGGPEQAAGARRMRSPGWRGLTGGLLRAVV